MSIDQELNKILKEMWCLDEKINEGALLNETEKDFYNKNLITIKNYYTKNFQYWNSKNNL